MTKYSDFYCSFPHLRNYPIVGNFFKIEFGEDRKNTFHENVSNLSINHSLILGLTNRDQYPGISAYVQIQTLITRFPNIV